MSQIAVAAFSRGPGLSELFQYFHNEKPKFCSSINIHMFGNVACMVTYSDPDVDMDVAFDEVVTFLAETPAFEDIDQMAYFAVSDDYTGRTYFYRLGFRGDALQEMNEEVLESRAVQLEQRAAAAMGQVRDAATALQVLNTIKRQEAAIKFSDIKNHDIKNHDIKNHDIKNHDIKNHDIKSEYPAPHGRIEAALGDPPKSSEE